MPCNAPNPPIYTASGLLTGDLAFNCRCVICPRCNMHTGNSTQGHFWRFCQVTATVRDYHWCCEDSCSLEVMSDATENTVPLSDKVISCDD